MSSVVTFEDKTASDAVEDVDVDVDEEGVDDLLDNSVEVMVGFRFGGIFVPDAGLRAKGMVPVAGFRGKGMVPVDGVAIDENISSGFRVDWTLTVVVAWNKVVVAENVVDVATVEEEDIKVGVFDAAVDFVVALEVTEEVTLASDIVVVAAAAVFVVV